MSTRNDKCPHCGALEVVFGTPLYTCGTTLEMGRVNRTVDCLATETKALLTRIAMQDARIAALDAHVARLEAIGDVFLKTLSDSLEAPLHWIDEAAQAERDWNQAKEAKP